MSERWGKKRRIRTERVSLSLSLSLSLGWLTLALIWLLLHPPFGSATGVASNTKEGSEVYSVKWNELSDWFEPEREDRKRERGARDKRMATSVGFFSHSHSLSLQVCVYVYVYVCVCVTEWMCVCHLQSKLERKADLSCCFVAALVLDEGPCERWQICVTERTSRRKKEREREKRQEREKKKKIARLKRERRRRRRRDGLSEHPSLSITCSFWTRRHTGTKFVFDSFSDTHTHTYTCIVSIVVLLCVSCSFFPFANSVYTDPCVRVWLFGSFVPSFTFTYLYAPFALFFPLFLLFFFPLHPVSLCVCVGFALFCVLQVCSDFSLDNNKQ